MSCFIVVAVLYLALQCCKLDGFILCAREDATDDGILILEKNSNNKHYNEMLDHYTLSFSLTKFFQISGNKGMGEDGIPLVSILL